jgi:hypothetical protein
MPLTDDPWIAKHSAPEPEKLHAIGYIIMLWNSCEDKLWALLTWSARIPVSISYALLHSTSDVTMMNQIRDVTKLSDLSRLSSEHAALIDHALNYYDICRLNRNQLCHFSIAEGHRDDDERIRFRRRKGADILASEPFLDSLDDIRQVADEVEILNHFLVDLILSVDSIRHGPQRPLPEKPPLPKRLLIPLPRNSPTQQSPPQSSPV